MAPTHYHSAMGPGAVDACGNCGAPLDLDEDGRCRWCRANVRPGRPSPHRDSAGRARPSWRWNWRLAAIAAVAVGAAAALGVGLFGYIGSHQSGPPATTAGRSSAAQAVPPASTDLQALRQDFGPWRQLSGISQLTGSPALLLLDGGSAYASERWTVPSTATRWAQDIGGNVASVEDSGNHATIMDTDGVTYTVGINQPFIISGNPNTVLLIRPGGTVMSMPLAQATAVRQLLRK